MSVPAAAFAFLLLVFVTPAVAQDNSGETAEFALSRAGDARKGKQVFGRCRACHALKGDKHGAGPSLQNIFGRQAGTATGFSRYSKAMRESGIVWNEQTLDEWLTNPLDFLPGNKMNMAPIRDPQQRMDLIAYLRDASE